MKNKSSSPTSEAKPSAGSGIQHKIVERKRDAIYFWIPAFAGMTLMASLTACKSSAIPQIGDKAINAELCTQYSREVPYDADRAKIVMKQIELYCD